MAYTMGKHIIGILQDEFLSRQGSREVQESRGTYDLSGCACWLKFLEIQRVCKSVKYCEDMIYCVRFYVSLSSF